MDSYSVQAVLSVKDKNFTSTMKSATNVLSGLDSSTSKSSSSVGALGTAFAVAEKVVSGACSVIKNSVQAAVERVDTLNQYPKIMEQMGFSSEAAEASIEKLSEGIQGLPTSLDSIVSSAQNIALISGNLDEATDVALALNNALIASGASTEAAASATEQYDKMLSTGKVNSQSWMTLQQNMGYALQEVAKQCGIASGSTQDLYTAMQDGTVTFDQFNSALIECSEAEGGFAEMAQTSSAGIATSWENVKTAVVRGVANMIQAWNEAAEDNGLPTIQESLNSLRNVCDTVFNAASKAITVFVNNLDTIVAACSPVVAAVAGLKIVQTVSKHFKDFKKSGKDAADALNNYTSKAERAESASKKLETAGTALNNAMAKQQEATNKLYDATEKLNDANAKVAAAEEKKSAALEKTASGTEDAAKASEELEAAEKELASATEEVTKAQQEQAKAQQEVSLAGEQVAAATELVADAHQSEASAIEGSTVKAIAHNAILAVMSGEMKIGEAAVKAFNAAMDANPIGMVTTAISALVSVVGVLSTVFKKLVKTEDSAYDKWKDLKEEIDDLNDSIEESNKEIESSISESKQSASQIKALANQVLNLANVQGLTADGAALLQSKLSQLDDLVPGLNASYDELSGTLNMTEEAFIALTEAAAAQEELAGAEEALEIAMEQRKETAEVLAETQAHLNEMDSESEIITLGTMVAYQKEQKASEELTAELAAQDEQIDKLTTDKMEKEAAVTEALQAEYDAQVAALQAAIAEETVTYDQLSEANQELVDELHSKWQGYVEDVLDGNNELSDSFCDVTDTESEEFQQAADDVAKAWNDTVENNLEVIENWGDNMETLRDRMEGLGYDAAVCDQLEEMGLEGADLVAAFVNASDDELVRFAENSERAAEDATTSMVQTLDASDVPDAVINLATQADESLRESLSAANWAEVASDCIDGLTMELESGAADANASGQVVGEQATEGVATGAETGSPSAATQRTGQDIVEGLALGMEDSASATEAAQTLGKNVVDAVNDALKGADFSSAVAPMCSKIADATKSGMSQVSKAVSSGMDDATKALTSGFSQMASATTSNMSTISSAVTSGMNNIKSNVTSVINSIKSNVTTQLNAIKTTVTSGVNAIKSTVTSGMNSIKSTIQSAMNTCKNYVTSGMNSIKSAFQSGMNSCVSVARSTCSSIISAFSGLYSSLYSAGANAMSGLQAGLNSRRGSVISTAQSIANSVTSTINSALRVGSPSKVLRQTGQYAGEGLVVGLKDMISDVKAMAGKMADAVTDMVFGSFDSPRLAFAGDMEMSVSYDYGTSDILDTLGDINETLAKQKEYTFTIPVEIDGREVAKATATFTEDQLNKIQARADRRNQFSIGG